jgi:ribosomal protein S18 acetylase RimI-like enzyme
MPHLTIRKFKRSELLTAFQMVLRSANDLRAKNGRKPWDTTVTEVPSLNYHIYDTDPNGTFGAYYDNKLVGYTAAIMRGRQWYLAYLFIDPEFQLKGVGRKLLERAWKYGQGKAESRALSTFPYNETALALYSSFGMMPTTPLLELYTKIDRHTDIHPVKLKAVQDGSARSIAWINRLEKEIRGYPHPVDHKFFSSDSRHKMFQFYDGAKWAGYAIVSSNGLIAPVGAVEPKYLPDIVTQAYNQCIDDGREIARIWAGGPNAAVFQKATSIGFRINEMTAFLSTKPYGDFYRYCPAHLAMF